MKNRGLFAILFLSWAALSGCGDNNDRLKQNAQITSEEAAKKSVEADNANLKLRSSEMEADLARRQRFVDAIVGTYEGKSVTSKDSFGTRIVLTSSLPAYVPPNRVRTLGEIENDLSSLFMSAEANIWDYDHTILGGCIFEKIRPNMQTGEINLISEKCQKSYHLKIVDIDLAAAPTTSSVKSFPARVLDGSVSQILQIEGTAQSIYGAETFEVKLSRK